MFHVRRLLLTQQSGLSIAKYSKFASILNKNIGYSPVNPFKNNYSNSSLEINKDLSSNIIKSDPSNIIISEGCVKVSYSILPFKMTKNRDQHHKT